MATATELFAERTVCSALLVLVTSDLVLCLCDVQWQMIVWQCLVEVASGTCEVAHPLAHMNLVKRCCLGTLRVCAACSTYKECATSTNMGEPKMLL